MLNLRKLLHWIKRNKILIILVLVAIAVIYFIFRPKPVPLLRTQKVNSGDLVQSVSVSGGIAAKNSANLSFLSSGPLVFLGANLGDTVKKGQTIAIVDQRTIEKNLANALKAYQNQKISFDITNDFNGDRALTDTGLSIAAFRQLQTGANTLDQAQIALDIQKIAKDQSVLYSPIDGVLTRSDASTVGMTVTTTTVYTIVDMNSLVFSMDVDEADIGKIKVGQPVKFILDAYPNDTFTFPVNRIDYVSHTAANGGNAFTVEVKMATDSAHQYRVGMNGNAEIITAEKKHVLTVPIASIVDDKYVFVKEAKGFKKTRINIGLENDTDAEVTNGLQAGDTIILQPDQIPPKMIVQ